MFLGFTNFLVSCEVDKAVLQESWDLDVDTWSRDSWSSLYSISLESKSAASHRQMQQVVNGQEGWLPLQHPLSRCTVSPLERLALDGRMEAVGGHLRKGKFPTDTKASCTTSTSDPKTCLAGWRGLSTAPS